MNADDTKAGISRFEAELTATATGQPVARSRIGRPIITLLLVLMLVFSACSEEGQQRVGDALENVETPSEEGGDEGESGAPAEEEPAPEPEPEPEPDPEPEAPSEPEAADDGEGLSSSDWILLIVLGLAAVAIVMGATTMASRRSQAGASAKAQRQRYLGELVTQSRWIHDSGSMELLLATDQDQLQRTWNDLRTRIINLESQIGPYPAGTGDENLDRSLAHLAQCLSDLRAAGEGYVTTRLRAGDEQADLVRSANQAVADRRAALQAAIDPVAAAMQT